MIIQLQNVSKSYSNALADAPVNVLSNLNFSISKADTIAIIGPSGSGKSTMLNIMGTLDAPTLGTVYFKGTDLALLSPNQLAELRKQKIGFIFQMHHLLPQLSVIENVLLPIMFEPDNKLKSDAGKRAYELLKRVGLHEKTNRLPAQLSVGECQRVAVVRALINEPEIILADEPTGSLDEDSANKLVDLLVEISGQQQVALVMVTHSSQLASKLKNTFKLAAGKLESTNKL